MVFPTATLTSESETQLFRIRPPKEEPTERTCGHQQVVRRGGADALPTNGRAKARRNGSEGAARATSALIGAHDENAAGRVVGELVRHGAWKRQRRAVHALGGDDQQIGVLFLGDGHQRP